MDDNDGVRAADAAAAAALVGGAVAALQRPPPNRGGDASLVHEVRDTVNSLLSGDLVVVAAALDVLQILCRAPATRALVRAEGGELPEGLPLGGIGRPVGWGGALPPASGPILGLVRGHAQHLTITSAGKTRIGKREGHNCAVIDHL